MSCDCEYPEFFTTKIRKANKTHKYCECSTLINTGDLYDYLSGKWDGFIGSFKTCLECNEIKDWLDKKIDCCIAFGELRTELIESDIISVFDPDDKNSPYHVIDCEDEVEMRNGFARLKKSIKL
jgi:hypothetical protein